MGIHRGPNTVKDGLVFGYDTGYGVADNSTATRFYPGEPATNNSILAAYTWNGDGGNQSFANKGATAITDNSLKYNGYDTVLWTPGGSQNCYLNGTGDFNYSDGSTVWTFSCYVKREDGAAITSLNVYMYYPSSDGAAAGTIVDCGNGWYRVSRTRTGGTSAIQLGGFTGFSAGNKYYLSGVMLSKTSHTVPYVAVQSSRSSTASLIDLKRTASIDVSNVSFDSTGQPTFDGTDDAIQLSSSVFNKSGSNPITVECVTKPGRLSGQYQDIVVNRSNSAYNWMLYQHTNDGSIQLHGGGQYKSTYVPVVGNYIHVVATVDASNNMVLYINGEVKQTVSSYAYASGQPGALSIGRFGTSSEPYLGDISVAKIYDTALSATQVAQNYKAYKNRFNL
jgi:hypothetical protein